MEKKLFLQIQSMKIVYLNEKNIIFVPITKRMEIIMSIEAYLISQINFDYEENDGKKAFPTNLKHQDRVSQWGEHDCCPKNKNRDYYEYPSLSYFMNEL